VILQAVNVNVLVEAGPRQAGGGFFYFSQIESCFFLAKIQSQPRKSLWTAAAYNVAQGARHVGCASGWVAAKRASGSGCIPAWWGS